MCTFLRIEFSQSKMLLCFRYFPKAKCGRFRSVLHEWFIETFPGPEAWYSARLMFTRTSAVMSIVGHILGLVKKLYSRAALIFLSLGDRHGENLLLREGHGGVLHVDFNCLFDKVGGFYSFFSEGIL